VAGGQQGQPVTELCSYFCKAASWFLPWYTRSTSGLSVCKSLVPKFWQAIYWILIWSVRLCKVAGGLLEATAIFATAARDASTELVVKHVEQPFGW
jgi:hypothetical protein